MVYAVNKKGTIKRERLLFLWEIRKVAIEILKILKKHASNVFGDFEIDEEKEQVKEV